MRGNIFYAAKVSGGTWAEQDLPGRVTQRQSEVATRAAHGGAELHWWAVGRQRQGVGIMSDLFGGEGK